MEDSFLYGSTIGAAQEAIKPSRGKGDLEEVALEWRYWADLWGYNQALFLA